MLAESPDRYDHVVVGSGLAGLTFAMRAAQKGRRVCVLTKGDVDESNTSWAQGGIAAAIGEADSWELHEQDTLIAGAGLCDEAAVRFLVQRAPDAIAWLVGLGARFDEEAGDLALGREGGHSRNRIVHHADRTGWEIERAMSSAVRASDLIAIYPHAFVTSLLRVDGRIVGASAYVNGLGARRFVARSVLLATGGCGKIYQHTTNPPVATGDGLALALRAGARLAGMEFMQFHPTTLYHPQMRSFLISEAVRGAGATLRNHLGRRFMYDYDPRLELAPRDVVARAIEEEMRRHNTWCVYLDATHRPAERLRSEFPTIYARLASIGIEMEKEWIPVVPAQHYSCGGVATDRDGRSSVPGLYAAGEVASTGVHGANRLASNSLLEAIVFAMAAERASEDDAHPAGVPEETPAPSAIPEAESVRLRGALQRSMTKNVGIVRTDAGLRESEALVADLLAEYASLPAAPFSRHPLETANLLLGAQAIVHAALVRRENIGLHYNADLA